MELGFSLTSTEKLPEDFLESNTGCVVKPKQAVTEGEATSFSLDTVKSEALLVITGSETDCSELLFEDITIVLFCLVQLNLLPDRLASLNELCSVSLFSPVPPNGTFGTLKPLLPDETSDILLLTVEVAELLNGLEVLDAEAKVKFAFVGACDATLAALLIGALNELTVVVTVDNEVLVVEFNGTPNLKTADVVTVCDEALSAEVKGKPNLKFEFELVTGKEAPEVDETPNLKPDAEVVVSDEVLGATPNFTVSVVEVGGTVHTKLPNLKVIGELWMGELNWNPLLSFTARKK